MHRAEPRDRSFEEDVDLVTAVKRSSYFASMVVEPGNGSTSVCL